MVVKATPHLGSGRATELGGRRRAGKVDEWDRGAWTEQRGRASCPRPSSSSRTPVRHVLNVAEDKADKATTPHGSRSPRAQPSEVK